MSFKKFLSTFIPNVFVAVIMLRWYAMQFLYRAMDEFVSGLPVTLGATVLLTIVVAIIVKKFTSPFDEMLNKVQTGYELTDEERIIALKVTRKVNWVITIACVVGFFIGQILVLIIEVSSGVREFHLVRLIFTVVQAVLIGFVVNVVIISNFEEQVSPYRRMLGINNYEQFSVFKCSSFKSKVFLVIIPCLLVLAINTLAVPFEIINRQNTAPVPNALANYLIWGIVSTIITMIPILSSLNITLTGYMERIKTSTNAINDIVKKGDLVTRLNIAKLDNIGELVSSINGLMDQLSGMIKSVRGQTDVVADSAKVLDEVADKANQAINALDLSIEKINSEVSTQNELIVSGGKDIVSLLDGVKDVEHHVLGQSSSVQESSASIAEMAANIDSVAEMTKKADIVSEELSHTTQKGNEAINEAIKSISEIQKASMQVQEIVKSIQKVASQTNLLSMNAAIEAAHAGEFGAGFAVVADEVRALAASSSVSTKEIQSYIKQMVEKINGGVAAINQAGNAFKSIEENVEKNTNLIQTISRAMDEQQIGAKETMTATALMVEATQAIRDLAESQSRYGENIKQMVENVINSSELVTNALSENKNAAMNIVNSIQKVGATVQKNDEAVGLMKNAVEKYKIEV